MSETYENSCAGCREKLKKDLRDISSDLKYAVYDAPNEISKGFHIGIAYGKLSYIIGNIPVKEDTN